MGAVLGSLEGRGVMWATPIEEASIGIVFRRESCHILSSLTILILFNLFVHLKHFNLLGFLNML